jgi:hypothetical protein
MGPHLKGMGKKTVKNVFSATGDAFPADLRHRGITHSSILRLPFKTEDKSTESCLRNVATIQKTPNKSGRMNLFVYYVMSFISAATSAIKHTSLLGM